MIHKMLHTELFYAFMKLNVSDLWTLKAGTFSWISWLQIWFYWNQIRHILITCDLFLTCHQSIWYGTDKVDWTPQISCCFHACHGCWIFLQVLMSLHIVIRARSRALVSSMEISCWKLEPQQIILYAKAIVLVVPLAPWLWTSKWQITWLMWRSFLII